MHMAASLLQLVVACGPTRSVARVLLCLIWQHNSSVLNKAGDFCTYVMVAAFHIVPSHLQELR